MQKIFKNWKTTSAGIVLIVTGVAMYQSNKTQIGPALSSVLGGIGLIFAHDAGSAQTPTT